MHMEIDSNYRKWLVSPENRKKYCWRSLVWKNREIRLICSYGKAWRPGILVGDIVAQRQAVVLVSKKKQVEIKINLFFLLRIVTRYIHMYIVQHTDEKQKQNNILIFFFDKWDIL